ncbi:MAG: VanZ family protein [Myxococcota bacterium]|nr:VanZ family protein [Myxococcota bacterium]
MIGLLVMQIVVIVYLGLTPFMFSLDNQVEAVANGPGVSFDAVAIGTSEGALTGSRDFPDERISLMFEIEPADEPRSGLGTIFSIEAQAGHTPLIVAQWKDWLVVRVRDPEHRSLGYWEIDAAGFARDERHIVTITSSPQQGTTIYVDGLPTGDTRKRSLARERSEFEGQLLLGCLSDGSAGWRGTLSGLAIANVVFTPEEITAQHVAVSNGSFTALAGTHGLVAFYDFAALAAGSGEDRYVLADSVSRTQLGRLRFPEIFTPMRPAVFGVPHLRDMKADWFFYDLVRNIAGFVPLGLFAAIILMRRSNRRSAAIAFQVAAIGAFLSFGIEAVQILLPMRSSSSSDLALNTIGALAGALIGLAFRQSRIAQPATGD